MEDKGKIFYLVKLLERSLIEKLVENGNEVKALIENDPRYFSIPSQKKCLNSISSISNLTK